MISVQVHFGMNCLASPFRQISSLDVTTLKNLAREEWTKAEEKIKNGNKQILIWSDYYPTCEDRLLVVYTPETDDIVTFF